jgi:hypothetical protein
MMEGATSKQEISLYDAVRTKAYAFSWKEGIPATVVYIFLVYLLIRFAIIYLKRYLTIYILALSAPFIGVKYAIDRLLGKKAKSNSLNKWFKDFAFNVLLQTVHVFMYTVFMGLAISVSSKSVAGALMAAVILNFMLQADKIIIKIFGLDKAGSLADVNKPESYKSLFMKFLPMYTISKGALGLAKKSVTDDYGFIRRKLDWVFAHNAETMKDANKIWEMRKYKLIGGIATPADWMLKKMGGIPVVGGVFQSLDKHLPVRHLAMLRQDLSYETKKNYYKDIKGYVQQVTGRYTRKVGLVKDLSLGTVGTIASLGATIADPKAGIALFAASRKMISKHKSIGKFRMKHDRYSGTARKAKEIKNKATTNYNSVLNTHVNNEVEYRNKYNELLDEYANSKNATEKNEAMDKIKKLRKERRIQKSIEMHKLQKATEDLDEAKFNYGNAKHEKNSKNKLGKLIQHDRRTFEKVTGLRATENILMTDSREDYNMRDKANKTSKKLDSMEKMAKQELELRKLTREFKAALKNDEVNGKKLTEEEANKAFENYMAKMVSQAEDNSAKSSYVTKAISKHFYKNETDKINTDNINSVLDDISKKINEENAKRQKRNKTRSKDDQEALITKITDEDRNKIKEALEKKMIEDNKGLGLEDKDAAEIIRKVLGSTAELDVGRIVDSDKNSRLSNIQNELFHKLVELNTANQVGKIKHKSQLINLNKAVKDAKKSGK